MSTTERSLNYAFHVMSRSQRSGDPPCVMTIPDTMFYEHGSLNNWYCTDHSGEVLKRDKREFSNDAIVQALCVDFPSAQSKMPVAVLLQYSGAMRAETSTGSPSWQTTPVSVEFYDRAALLAFLGAKEKKHLVMLQRFVTSGTRHFSTVQVVWSPKQVHTMQRQNVCNLMDERISVNRRCETLDSSRYSTDVKTTGRINNMLAAECQKIVDHILLIEQRRVLRMVAFFCFNQKSVPHFLYATEMQIAIERPSYGPTRLRRQRPLGAAPMEVRHLVQLSPLTGDGDLRAAMKMADTFNFSTQRCSTRIANALTFKNSIDSLLGSLDEAFETSRKCAPIRKAVRPKSALAIRAAQNSASLEASSALEQRVLNCRQIRRLPMASQELSTSLGATPKVKSPPAATSGHAPSPSALLDTNGCAHRVELDWQLFRGDVNHYLIHTRDVFSQAMETISDMAQSIESDFDALSGDGCCVSCANISSLHPVFHGHLKKVLRGKMESRGDGEMVIEMATAEAKTSLLHSLWSTHLLMSTNVNLLYCELLAKLRSQLMWGWSRKQDLVLAPCLRDQGGCSITCVKAMVEEISAEMARLQQSTTTEIQWRPVPLPKCIQ